jgi:hypothetical protein
MNDIQDIDIHAVLAERGEIAILWSIEDVKTVRPDLTEVQAWQVLTQAERRHDADVGISWHTLECLADNIFPIPATSTKE